MNTGLQKQNSSIALPDNEIALRNRKLLLEYLSGRKADDIALRYGLAVTELTACISAAFEDIKQAEFHRDIRSVLVQKIVNNIEKIENWMEHLSPKYKKYHQQLGMDNKPHELWEEVEDHLAFVKFTGELRAQYAFLQKLLGADLPAEQDTAKEHIQKKMLDALSASLQIARNAQEAKGDERVQRTILDVEDIIDVEVEEKVEE